MTEQEALNMLLRAIGSSPVNDIETPHPDAVNARKTLDRARQTAQKRGWWFNIDYGVTYQPDPITKEILIPVAVTTAIFESPHLVKRGTKLYNNIDNTYQFDAAITASRVVRVLEWEYMPDSMQEYCAYFAAAEYVRDELEDINKEQSFQTSAGIAMLTIKKEDLEHGQYNMFQNSTIRNARAGVQPYQRNNQRFYGTPDV